MEEFVPEKFPKRFEVFEHFRRASDNPARHVGNRHAFDQVDRLSEERRHGELAFCSGSALGALIVVAYDVIAVKYYLAGIKPDNFGGDLLVPVEVV